jgi:hypothetical protein
LSQVSSLLYSIYVVESLLLSSNQLLCIVICTVHYCDGIVEYI